MPNEKRLRLHQVARELKVGQTTIIEFLDKKGIKVDKSPSSIIEPAVYAILDKEFGGNKQIEKVNIREKIGICGLQSFFLMNAVFVKKKYIH